jgi:autotransporter-associated beta strand protein
VLDAVNVSGSTTVNTGAKLRMNVIDSANLGALTANGTVSLAYISNSNSSRTVTVTSLAGSGTVFGDAQGLNNSATLIINGASTSTFSGLIANGGNSVVSLTKNGSGVQNLTGNNTYTGTTLVNGGTLFVNGNQASATGAVSVASGATLGGSGTIGGATSISGILAPGNSIGTLNITANTTWQGASLASSDTDWKFELGSTNTSDLLNITGSFLKDNASGSVFRFDFLNSSITGNFTLVAWTGSTTFSASDFTYSNLGADKTGTFFISGNQLRFEVVPEPGTWALLATSLTTLLILRRRRR